ncbi:MAG: HlyD family efflux transporter periplasmic adaptor subunit [Burkholderiales bacterium]
MAIPTLRQDLKLYEGPLHRDGSPSWRILDPIRNRFFEIGWLEFELLAHFDECADVESLIEAVAADTTLSPTDEEVEGFFKFLENQQLVVQGGAAERDKLRERWLAADKPWYEKLFHGYLFFRIPLFRPDKFLFRTLPFIELFYTRAFAAVVFLVFVVDLYLVFREWDELSRSFAYFFNLQGGLYFLIAASFSKIIHELGHAYTAKRYGVRIPTMGIAFLVMWPVPYTDTGETWKLADWRKQLAIASAGMGAELVLAIFATLLWAITPDGNMKYMLFVLATTTWIITLALNASPFMRFDGYFLLSDALDFPNLHERSSACARWWIRRSFFGLREALPEPTFTVRQRFGLVVFALVVWVYRLVVFLGIAILVYHMFFKILGIVMMVLELVWFIFKPVWTEFKYLWEKRAQVRIGLVSFSTTAAILAALIWMIPVTNELTAPAVARAETVQEIYSPVAARIVTIAVKDGEKVERGQLLFQLEAPELFLRATKAEVALSTARSEFLRAVATTRQQERREVLLQQIAEALAEQQSVKEDSLRLEIRAGESGFVRDMSSQVMEERWINSRELLARVISPSKTVIEAYIAESRVKSVSPGQTVRFIPEIAGARPISGVVREVDATATRQVNHRVLASPYGGAIAAVVDKRGVAMAQDPVYRILIEPSGEFSPVSAVVRGTVRVEVDLEILAQNFVSRAISLFVRESGF